MRAALHARLRVGSHHVAVAAPAVLAAVRPRGPLVPLPRRGGALAGACPTPWGLVPVVDLSQWIDMGSAAGADGQVLVLQDGRRRVAVRADALHGVARASDVQRLHQDDDPQQLFQSAVSWADGAAPSPLLEVGRLAELAQAWADGLPQARDEASAATGSATGGQPHAVLQAGGCLWALPAAQLVQVRPAVPLDYAIAGDGATRGFCTWDGSKLPVLDLGRLHGLPAAGGALMALVADGDRAATVLADAVRQVVALPVGDGGGVPRLVQGLGEVRAVDAAALLRGLPQAGLARWDGGTGSGRVRAGAAHLLFEQDAVYAAPAAPVLQVLPLDAAQSRALAAGEPVHLPWRDRLVPAHALPCYSGREAAGPPRVALVVDRPGADGPAAIAVAGLRGWDTVSRSAGLRVATMGEVELLTVGDGPQRSSHLVVDLAAVAHALG